MVELPAWDNVVLMDHPLIQHKLSILRDKNTGSKVFREMVRELTLLMAYEATRGFQLGETTVTTPITETTTKVLIGKKVAIVPILRAGLGMVDGILELLPAARVGHIGLFRDETTLEPVEYYCKLPRDIDEREVLVVDPMLATGGSIVAAVRFLRERGAGAIKLLVLIAAPEGIERVVRECDDVRIFCCAIDDHLNERGFIVPGLGDAGDRLFGTK